MTTDGLRLIGPLPGHPGVVLVTGHNMLGLMLAPATGRLVTGLLTGKPDDSPIPRFAPAEPSGGGSAPLPDACESGRDRAPAPAGACAPRSTTAPAAPARWSA
ncbi:FAD-dependent oxidoreductase [Streptomyces mirabilis]|uniref:FAD-dependent oxidoreductase n=1 Tax=Streptomyces mirabilis TaxID=68239 RepID=UPI003CCF210C